MKKSLRNSILLLLTAMLLTVSALADSGPKPQLTVRVKSAPDEPYYLDLLAEGAFEHEDDVDYSGVDWSYHGEKRALLDDGLLEELRAHLPEGIPSVFISSVSGLNIARLKDMLWEALQR